MLIQQLKELEKDGIVTRTVYRQRPPRVDTRLPTWAKPWGRLWPNSSIGPYMRNEGKPKGRVPGGLAGAAATISLMRWMWPTRTTGD
jgi:hypothetical protein